MKWLMTYYKGVAENIENDWPVGIQRKYVWTVRLLTSHGPKELGMSHVKALGKGLFEIRVKGSEGIGRAIILPAG